MSLILDALNRSRQDEDQVPGLATQHYELAEKTNRPAWQKILPWIGLAAALAVIAWLLSERVQEAPVENLPIAEKLAPAAVVKPAVKVEPEPVVRIPEPTAPMPDQLSKDPLQATASSDPAGERPVKTADVKGPAADPVVSALYQQEKAGKTPVAAPTAAQGQSAAAAAPQAEAWEKAQAKVEENPIDLEAMVARARDEIENANLAEHPAPFISDLSQQTKDAIPSVFYQRHEYNGSSANSQVVLNGKELRVGARPAPGIKVEEILPDSVVLSFQGTEFRLRALNSWVNL